MSSPEVEKFEITDDDVYNSFNIRHSRRQTKNQATFGIWADEEDDNERPGFGGRGKKKSDFTAPIGFVSGGIKQGDKTFKPGEEEEADAENDADFDMGDIARLSYKWSKKEKAGSSSGSGRSRSNFIPGEKDFGGWEKHTKGVGMKLMQKMGFEVGKGLGKNKQGIVIPVEAVKRKGAKAGIGLHGTERSERSLVDFPTQDKDEQEEAEFKEQLSQWRKEPEGKKKKKVKYTYKTAQEAIESGSSKKKGLKSQMSNVKVIDMTGKEKKEFTGYHTISQRHDRPDDEPEEFGGGRREVFSMPELLHNLNLLVDMSEEDIIHNDRKLKHDKDLIVNMGYEKEKLDSLLEQEEKQIQRLTKILDIIATVNERTNPGCPNPVTLDECLAIFRILQNDFYAEYKMYELESLAVALVFPIMGDYFKTWSPLGNPGYGVSVVKEWQYMLGDPNHVYVKDQNNMDVYQRLIWDIWLPHVRSAVLTWNVRNCDPLIELLETWMPVLPMWVMENIQDQLVIPRLMAEVEAWNPLTDTVPIHSWLHPWLPLMKDKLEPLYAPIRHKLGNALTNWHPSDSSAKVILKPWNGVFRDGHMEVFLRKHIVPKLELCLQEFPINPHQQTLEPLNWVFTWTDMISLRYMVPVFEKCFFSRWLQVLCTWLGNMPNYEEVTKWYLGWKSVFSEQYMSHPVIKEMFTKALDMMNRAVSGHFQPGVKENMAYFTLNERRTIGEPATSRSNSPATSIPQTAPFEPPGVRASMTTYPASFRELVERKAEESNLVFLPVPGRTHEAKQVYRCGRVLVYFDRSVVFVMDDKMNAFVPVSLQKLIEMAKG
ncbi:tuftelin-interacting protein 11-like isoform X2 [Dreissena polymorpha]|nr:tuftelin-interacting protein 11-like isoform X2 [Dreissena polymorpha]